MTQKSNLYSELKISFNITVCLYDAKTEKRKTCRA